jgi:hypothetical protein
VFGIRGAPYSEPTSPAREIAGLVIGSSPGVSEAGPLVQDLRFSAATVNDLDGLRRGSRSRPFQGWRE